MLQFTRFFKRKSASGKAARPSADMPTVDTLAEKIENARKMARLSRKSCAATVEDLLSIECPDPTAEDRIRDGYQKLGQRLVRQESWAEISDVIREADAAKTLTPGLMPVAELIAFGVRADVVASAERAVSEVEGRAPDAALDGIEALEHVLEEHADDRVIAAIVAQTHLDIGWAWRGNGWDVEIPQRNREAFAAHFDRARDIIKPFTKSHPDSALIAATHCAQLSGPAGKRNRVADRYEHLIDLNPHNPRPMRAMGNHLLPRWFGSYPQLELEARRTAARTEHIWGAGGYTWVQFDAISCDDQACANLDLPFFVDGLRDILTRKANPYTENLLAAYCANTISQSFSGNDEADHIRAQISDCTEWIVREYLTELHPMIWAHAAHGFDNTIRIRSPQRFAASGREDAMRIMAGLFKTEIAAGNRIVFTEEGMHTTTA